MSTTPRTDAAYFRQGATMYDLARESKKLETELADAKLDAEDQAKWALSYLARAEKAEAELAKRDSEYLRGANMVAESASVWQTRAEKAEAELAEMSSIAEKWEDDALRYAINAEYWQSRAEKAKADTARIDWLEENMDYIGGGSGGTYTFFTPADVECGMLRDAIDAAMKEDSK